MRKPFSLLSPIFLACELLMRSASAAGVPADMIQPNSVWRGEGNRVLTILERNGDTYRGRYELGGNIVREITGPVKGDQISWLAKDVHAVKGNPGGDNFGTIVADRIEFKWTDSKSNAVHNFTLVRVPFQNGQNGPSSVPSATAGPPTASVAARSASIKANQPLLETLSLQAPNATAWVLAPLDAAVPPNIRQNLTYLREDLLDETANKPKASADAYKSAKQLCNTMIAVLDERDRALATAGFRAVEAQARTGVTSQALEARRNSMMSWPQFAREESQRAELKSQAVNSAAVMAERPKLEWATRTAALRNTLDTLYAQFREALRQSAAAK